MIRYQQLNLKNLNSQAEKLWDEIKKACLSSNGEYNYELVPKTDLGPIARIRVNKPNLVSSLIVLAALAKNNVWEKIYVANIVPQKPALDRLTMEEYNKILAAFKSDIVDKSIDLFQNMAIEYSSAQYSIEECIPKSYESFKSWISAFPLSYHQFDMERWYKFVSALHINREELGLDDFENCLTQDYRWSQEDAEEFSSRLSDELDLLKVYDSVR